MQNERWYFTSLWNVLPVAIFLVLAVGTPTNAEERPDVSSDLEAGKLTKAEQTLQAHLGDHPTDDLARFQLGAVQFFRAVEQLGQDGARYGALSRTLAVPFFRVGGLGSDSLEPRPVTYEDLRQMLVRFEERIVAAEQTLAAIKDPTIQWELNLAKVRLDLNGDGRATDEESLASLFSLVANRGRMDANQAVVTVGFDAADVYWLRGYCHVLSALSNTILAYDQQRLFDLTAHAFFAKPQTEFAKLRNNNAAKKQEFQIELDEIADLIAAIHLMNFELIEPQRMTKAQEHLLKTIEMSRKSWELIEAETDNNNEWIPGPKQQSVIPGMVMTGERVKAWRQFLTEGESIVRGEKLVPFWRNGFKGGINLGKVFREPRRFDLVLWVQGTAALPYLEEGEVTSSETWQEFQRIFSGEFIGFAAWIN